MNRLRELAGPVRRVGVRFVKGEKTFQELERKKFMSKLRFANLAWILLYFLAHACW